MKGRALGRGLSALIPGADSTESVSTIPLDKISANPFQPRTEMNVEAIKELAQSIEVNGVIQPIAVRRHADGYQLITGARRVTASRMAGLQEIPAVILEIDSEAQMLEIALVENLQREDLNPMELAAGYQRLMTECGVTQEEVARKVGKGRPTVANTLRLLKLPKEIQDALRQDKITMGHARALLSAEDLQIQMTLFRRTMKEGISVRILEKLVSKPRKSVKIISEYQPNPFITDIEDRLRTSLATRIKLKRNKKGGVIEIYYYSDSELERLVENLESADHNN
ncbi:ParB/RepB/Spo0J family partition protein [bacterium]|nr:ParB/RepB/Spo0J family partition protein [FCB group bacterium]MBL7190485.1 ParB/RepB/Spo0J family partition protein [bacterium]